MYIIIYREEKTTKDLEKKYIHIYSEEKKGCSTVVDSGGRWEGRDTLRSFQVLRYGYEYMYKYIIIYIFIVKHMNICLYVYEISFGV